ncbi:hypothetical protein B7494_g1787 [Chlorociboria aeruginascens]|nr:hypothetical protein B7494_g1787 [Chlorociboria aeruginascens]
MGDATKNGKSRMGLTLQGYDQVIALSQTNINQTLKRCFKVDQAKLANFKAIIGTADDPDYALVGKIDPPTIELIDADKADQAIYSIKFQSGAKYTYFGPDRTNVRGIAKKFEISASGWVLAFFVNFAMEKCERMPDDVKEVVMRTGSYSVDQLVIVFGTADLMDFNWDRSKFPNIDDKATLLDAKTQMAKFIHLWLMDLRTGEAGNSHNILGYTVKIDVESNDSREQLLKKIGDTPPSFPPTKVQFQTIANKSDAGSKGDPADPYNAFLFTEMCGIPEDNKPRPLPQHDLQWSGNWFYGTIGGTMAMSSGIFLKEFVGKLVEPIHKSCTGFADSLAKRQTWDAEVRMARVKRDVKFLGDWIHGKWVLYDNNQWMLESTSTKQHTEIPWRDNGKSSTVQVNVQAVMSTWLKPYPGTGNFDIEQRLHIVTKWSNFSIQYSFDATSSFNWTYAVQLFAVSSGGELSSTVTYTKNEKPALTATITIEGVLVRGIASNQNEQERQDWDKYQSLLKDTIENRMPSSTDFTSTINRGLNSQKKFIFPGGGTFDMSDPLFNEAGDLLLGLVYR